MIPQRSMRRRIRDEAPRGVAELRQRAGLELADALAGEAEVAADVVERARLAVEQAEAQLEDDPLALRQAGDDVEQLLAGEALRGDLERVVGVAVLDEVAELGVAVLADRGLEGRGRPGVGEELLDGGDLFAELGGELLHRGLAAEGLGEVALHRQGAADALHHVDGQADRAALVGHAAADGLADPPRRVGRELVAAAVVELLDRAEQPEVALLDEVEQRQALALVALRDGDDEPEVRLDEALLGALAVAVDLVELAAALDGQLLRLADQPLGLQTGLVALREVDLLLGGEQGGPGHLPQVQLHVVVQRHLFDDLGHGGAHPSSREPSCARDARRGAASQGRPASGLKSCGGAAGTALGLTGSDIVRRTCPPSGMQLSASL
jgi:hypothetical protein